ncbi:MAG: outer membrane beta-barrel protein [Chitinophagales bacterium]|jgi:hypothetical protein
MKNIIVIVFLLPLYVCATPDSLALKNAKPKIFKTGSRPRLQFGAQVGANLNYFVYKNGVQRDVSAGYQGGFFFRVTRQKAFVQFEMNFLRSTVKLKNGVFSSQFGNNIPFSELKMKYHTVGIPFIFGAYAVKKPIYKLRFYNGIEAEFIAKTKATITQNNNEVYRLKRQEKRDIFRPAQFSYQLGMGMDIAMFIFDAKYSVGTRSFFKENYRTQTHLFQFTVGAIF